MARPQNTDERRAQITRGLMRVMAKQGFDGASVVEIARAAGLTTGLVHYHFDDKLEILEALAMQLAKDNLAGVDARLSRFEGQPVKALGAVIDYYLGLGDAADPEALACWIALSGEALRHARVKGVFAGTLARVCELVLEQIEAGVRRKQLRPKVDPREAAAALVTAIQGYFIVAGTAPALIPKGSAARTLKLMMTGLLGAKV